MGVGDINLIAKIAPKNDAFAVIVEAEHAGIVDAGGFYTGTDVETALQEIGGGSSLLLPYLKLDQTTPQNVINDAPHFQKGLVIKSGEKLVFDGA